MKDSDPSEVESKWHELSKHPSLLLWDSLQDMAGGRRVG